MPAPEGGLAQGYVESVIESKCKNGSVRYGITVAGETFGTFSKAHADEASAAKDAGKPVSLAYTQEGKFRNVASITVEPDAQ